MITRTYAVPSCPKNVTSHPSTWTGGPPTAHVSDWLTDGSALQLSTWSSVTTAVSHSVFLTPRHSHNSRIFVKWEVYSARSDYAWPHCQAPARLFLLNRLHAQMWEWHFQSTYMQLFNNASNPPRGFIHFFFCWHYRLLITLKALGYHQLDGRACFQNMCLKFYNYLQVERKRYCMRGMSGRWLFRRIMNDEQQWISSTTW